MRQTQLLKQLGGIVCFFVMLAPLAASGADADKAFEKPQFELTPHKMCNMQGEMRWLVEIREHRVCGRFKKKKKNLKITNLPH